MPISQVQNRVIDRRRNHTGRKHEQVDADFDRLAEQGVFDFDEEVVAIALAYAGDITLCQEDTLVVLGALIEKLVLTGCPHVFIKYVSFRVRIFLADIRRLLQRT